MKKYINNGKALDKLFIFEKSIKYKTDIDCFSRHLSWFLEIDIRGEWFKANIRELLYRKCAEYEH